jgi:hypothetical protein
VEPLSLSRRATFEYLTSRATSVRWRLCQRSNGVISSAA